MSSTRAAYDNSGALESGKSFSRNRVYQVRSSDLPRHLRDGLASIMEAFNSSGDDLWMSYESGGVAVGKVFTRRECRRIQVTRTQGPSQGWRALGPCEYMSRRAVYSLIKTLHQMDVLEQKHPPHSWVKYKGEWIFRQTATYRLVAERLRPRFTPKQHRADRKGPQPVTDIPPRVEPPRVEPPKAAPVTPIAKPATREHRSTERTSEAPRLTPRQRKELVRKIPIFMKGYTHTEFGTQLEPDDPRYRDPMDQQSATLAACKLMCKEFGVSLKRAIEAALEANFRVEPSAAREALAHWTVEEEAEERE